MLLIFGDFKIPYSNIVFMQDIYDSSSSSVSENDLHDQARLASDVENEIDDLTSKYLFIKLYKGILGRYDKLEEFTKSTNVNKFLDENGNFISKNHKSPDEVPVTDLLIPYHLLVNSNKKEKSTFEIIIDYFRNIF